MTNNQTPATPPTPPQGQPNIPPPGAVPYSAKPPTAQEMAVAQAKAEAVIKDKDPNQVQVKVVEGKKKGGVGRAVKIGGALVALVLFLGGLVKGRELVQLAGIGETRRGATGEYWNQCGESGTPGEPRPCGSCSWSEGEGFFDANGDGQNDSPVIYATPGQSLSLNWGCELKGSGDFKQHEIKGAYFECNDSTVYWCDDTSGDYKSRGSNTTVGSINTTVENASNTVTYTAPSCGRAQYDVKIESGENKPVPAGIVVVVTSDGTANGQKVSCGGGGGDGGGGGGGGSCNVDTNNPVGCLWEGGRPVYSGGGRGTCKSGTPRQGEACEYSTHCRTDANATWEPGWCVIPANNQCCSGLELSDGACVCPGTGAAGPSPSPSASPEPGLSCTELKTDKSGYVLGDTVELACKSPAGKAVDHFQFRYKVSDSEEWVNLDQGGATEQTDGSFKGSKSFVIDQAKTTYQFQCRVCKDAAASNCTNWGKNQ